jgi:hypothetical protein
MDETDERLAMNEAEKIVRRDMEEARQIIREVVPQYKSLLMTYRHDLMDVNGWAQCDFGVEYAATLIVAEGLSFCAVSKPTQVAAARAIVEKLVMAQRSMQLPADACAASTISPPNPGKKGL